MGFQLLEVFRAFDGLGPIGLKRSSKMKSMKLVGRFKESLKLLLMSLGICLEWVTVRGINV